MTPDQPTAANRTDTTPTRNPDAPWPGVRLDEHDEPLIPSDGDRERHHDDARGVLAVVRNDWTLGTGIGMEPDGYLQTHYVAVVDLGEWSLPGGRNVDALGVDACPECGSEQARYATSQDTAGIVGSWAVTCNACDHQIAGEWWD